MKKMRRLIPAIAMLLVSAVMLSTASFAWFTMNSEVEATGMTVQAKSDGSMVIDTKPLTAASTGWEAQFAAQGNKKLVPVSYGTYKVATRQGDSIQVDETPSTGWYDAFDNKLVDSMTGASPYYKAAADNNNYIDYVVYIGMASESEVKNVQVTLTEDLGMYIAGAYAVAFYVDKDITDATTVDTAFTTGTPDLILHCTTKTGLTKDDKAVTNTGKLFTEAVTIPSTIGVDAGADGVGIKVTMRVFIDGDLKDGLQYTPVEPEYGFASGAFDPNATYYEKQEDGTYKMTVLDPAKYLQETTAQGNVYNNIEANTYYVVTGTQNGTPRDTYFVRTMHAPQAPSQLAVSFELVD